MPFGEVPASEASEGRLRFLLGGVDDLVGSAATSRDIPCRAGVLLSRS